LMGVGGGEAIDFRFYLRWLKVLISADDVYKCAYIGVHLPDVRES
jgi:hypothetical protein